MSINQLVKPVQKKWLDTHIGGVIIDGELTYDETNKVENDSLVLDLNKVAKWTPISNLTLGSIFTGRLKSTSLFSGTTVMQVVSVSPFPAIYTLVDGAKIKVSATGEYLVIAVLFSTDTSASYAASVAVNDNTDEYARQVAGPSTILGYNKVNNYCFTTLLLNADDYITVATNSISGTGVPIFSSGSFVVVSRIN